MNNFSEQEDSLVLENLCSGVRQIDRTFHPVTKSERFGQNHSHVRRFQCPSRCPDVFDRQAPVMFLNLRRNGFHHLGGAEIYFFGGRERGCTHTANLLVGESGSSPEDV